MVKCQLQCKSGKVFIVEIDAISKSVIVKNMLDDLGMGKDPTIELEKEVIPLPNISEACMGKVIEWCQQHKDDPAPPVVDQDEEDLMILTTEIGEWDKRFLKMDDSTLFDLILAANYLDIKGLLDVATTHVAQLIANAGTPEAIRQRFNIKNDLTDEDLKKIELEAASWLDTDSEDEEDKKTTRPKRTATAAIDEPSATAVEPTPSTSQAEGAVGGVEYAEIAD